MASATKKASSLTTLKIGNVAVPVGLFSMVATPSKLAAFETAGPHGGKLKAEYRARPVPVAEVSVDEPDVPVHSSDPFADDEPAMAKWVHAPSDEEPAPVQPDAAERIAETLRDEFPDVRIDEQSIAGPMIAAVGAELDAMRAVGDVDPQADAEQLDRVVQEVDADPGPEPTPVMVERMSDDLSPPLVDPEWAQARTAVDGEYGRVLVEEGTGEVVEPDQVRRGVRLEDGRFIDCTAPLAQIEEETKLDQMEVLGFVDSTQVPRTRVKAAQYVGAGDEKAPRALRIMFEALKATRRMALVKLTKRSRQTLGVIGVSRGVLVLLELVWAEDFREPPARAKVIQKETISEREVEMFIGLVQAMGVPVSELDALRDDAIARREELRAIAEAGELPAEVIDAEVVGPADDLMAQLEASLAAMGS